jgi:hypothetical protein
MNSLNSQAFLRYGMRGAGAATTCGAFDGKVATAADTVGRYEGQKVLDIAG